MYVVCKMYVILYEYVYKVSDNCFCVCMYVCMCVTLTQLIRRAPRWS